MKGHKMENKSVKHENMNDKIFPRSSILFWRALITWSKSSLPLTVVEIAREKERDEMGGRWGGWRVVDEGGVGREIAK